MIIGGNGMPKPDGYRLAPEWLSPLTHPLIAMLVVPLSALWARTRGWAPRIDGEQVLLLLALLLLLRCVLDPWNTSYYELPFLLSLVAWEALCRPERPPVLALAASLIVWVTFQEAPRMAEPGRAIGLLPRVVAAADGVAGARVLRAGRRGGVARAHASRDPRRTSRPWSRLATRTGIGMYR